MSEAAVPSRRRELTRQRLLDAAQQVFAESGFDAASVEDVCERAGFTRGAFYSNFESKEGLFLALVDRVSGERLDAVRRRISTLERSGDFVPASGQGSAMRVVQQVLDVSGDDRLGVLLMSEIRVHALRQKELAAAYLALEESMCESVAQIIGDVAKSQKMALRLPLKDVARTILSVWESEAIRGAMQGLGFDEMRGIGGERIAQLAELFIVPPTR
ncbi:AcrR family transcriptional regulator [Microbacterium halimionae]|uniref:AcrR family transcriptional regulator n=1 Tax=Microbacterium halimionae TaxID=1526413 RepID=A0A7W3JM46_9MICO|nr:TetR/AcrR family transcriptional regulator [Microbacterium halimionae]MBA8815333.1 AcrR family transcriptional regulator [Microbacterium halimionae]NII93876.1 AcrR family transcriptional regulator [Microbacterium halimionae]